MRSCVKLKLPIRAAYPYFAFWRPHLRETGVLVVEINNYIRVNAEDTDIEYAKFFRILFSATHQRRMGDRAKWLSEIAKALSKEQKKIKKRSVKPIESTDLLTSIIETIGAVVKAFF